MREQAVGEAESILHVAVRNRRDEGALDQIWIARIKSQSFAKERRRRHRVMLGPRDQRREIIAGRAFANLERGCDRHIVLCPGFRAREGGSDKPRPRDRSPQFRATARRLQRQPVNFPGKL